MAVGFRNKRGSNVTDYSTSFINIDTLCYVTSQAQKESNRPVTFKEKNEYTDKEETTCDKCQTPCNKEKPKTEENCFAIHGLFDETVVESDEDQEYICEMCSSLGYHRKYRPEICDVCHICEACAEYQDEECDGCSYSKYRDGMYYREKLSDSDLFEENDIELFNDVRLDAVGGQRFNRTKNKFSVRHMPEHR